MKNIYFCMALILLQTGLAEAKKTVCSITINSSDEINMFKSKLSSTDFNFVELTSATGDSGWLQNSCDAKT